MFVKKSALLVGTVAQALHYVRHRRRFPANLSIACVDLDVAGVLAGAGEPFVLLSGFLNGAQIEVHFSQADNLTREWYRSLFSADCGEVVSAAEALAGDFRPAFFSGLNFLFAFESFCERESFEQLWVFSGEGQPLWGSESETPPDFHVGLALFAAEKLGIRTRIVANPRKGDDDCGDSTVAAIGRYACTATIDFFSQRRKPGATRILGLFLVPQDYAEQAPLAERLLSAQDIIYLPVRIGNYFSMPLFQCCELDFSDYLAVSWPHEAAEAAILSALRQFKNGRCGLAGQFPAFFANRYVSFQFRSYWDRLRMAVRYAAGMRVLIAAIQPDIATFGTMHGGFQKLLLQTAKNAGVEVMTIIHGGITRFCDYKNGFPPAGLYCIWGETDYAALQQHGLDMSRVRVVGSLRHLPMHDCSGFSSTPSTAAGSQSPTVLVVTCDVDIGLRSGGADLAVCLTNWLRLAELARRRSSWRFVLKPHPRYDHFLFYEALLRQFPGCFEQVRGRSLQEVLPETDVVLMVNAQTTAALEALQAHVPILLLSEGSWQAPSARTILDEGPWVVDRWEDLEGALESVIAHGELRARILEAGSELLRRFWGADPSHALERAVTVVEELRLKRREQHKRQAETSAVSTLAFQIGILRSYVAKLHCSSAPRGDASHEHLPVCGSGVAAAVWSNYLSSLPSKEFFQSYSKFRQNRVMLRDYLGADWRFFSNSLAVIAALRRIEAGQWWDSALALLRSIRGGCHSKDGLRVFLMLIFGGNGVSRARSWVAYLSMQCASRKR
jgi:hypothetical protein